MNAPAAQPQNALSASLGKAISLRERPPRPGPISTSFTFGWRALLKIKHVPMQLFDVTGFPIMFTLMFTYLFGGAISGSPREYLQYLLPGILVQTVSFITMYTAMGINVDVGKGVFDRFRSLPIWHPSVLVGALLGDAVRYTIASTVVIGLGLIMGFRPEGGFLTLIPAVLLLLGFAFSLSWIWTMVGLMTKTMESVMMISSMIVFFLTFASNIFVDPATMPKLVQAFVKINPVTHAVTAVRALMHGSVTSGQLLQVAISCAVMVGVFGPITMRLYRKKQ